MDEKKKQTERVRDSIARLTSARRTSLLLFAAFAVGACLTGLQPRTFADSTPRESQVCLDCHEGFDTNLGSTAHRLSDVLDGVEARVTCTDCHAGDPRHYEEDPQEFPMPSLTSLSAVDAAQTCSACHLNAHQQNMLERNVHVENDVNCSACHSVHASAHPALLREQETTLCLSCHRSVEGQFAKPYRHPLNDGIMTCSECHLSLDLTSRELSFNGSSVCTDCHGEFQGPFPFEHQATVDYSTQEGGCLTCHDAHGSYLPRMLKQPYESPHNQLCSQCHSVPRHNNNTWHGTMWAGRSCSECHTDIHGSYISRKFFSEELQGQGCFNSGCHQF